MKEVIGSLIALDDPEHATEFPSAGLRSSEKGFQEIYWRCVAVCFATSLKQNPTVHHVLFCNRPLGELRGIESVRLLQEWGVELIYLPFTYRLPPRSVKRFGNVFYELDVFQFVAKAGWEKFVFTDCDCVWVEPAGKIFQRLNKHPIITYTLAPDDQIQHHGSYLINGMTRERMKAIAESVTKKGIHRDLYVSGGEFLAFTQNGCLGLVKHFAELWNRTITECWLEDSIKTEEHFLTILFEALDVPHGLANDLIRRMWTHFSGHNLKKSDLQLAIWHLPAEKRFGFRTLYSEVRNPKAPFWNSNVDTTIEIIRDHMGVPRRTGMKVIRDVKQKCLEKVSAHLEPATSPV